MHARCPDVDRGGTGPRPGLELADILRRHLDGYRQSHALSLSGQAVLRDLMSCRTAALGGHMDTCTACGFERPSYNSCRNRHCPKCQALAQARWVEARLDRILRVPHFHLVFTLPSDLRQLCRQSPAVMSTSCSRPPPLPSRPWLAIPSGSAPRSSRGSRPSCTPGLGSSSFTPTPIASSPVVGLRSMEAAGSPPSQTSSFPCASSGPSFAASSSQPSRTPFAMAPFATTCRTARPVVET